MRNRASRAALALCALTAAGVLLSGCYAGRPYDGPYYAAPGYGYRHHYDHDHRWRHGDGHRDDDRGGWGHY